MPCYDSRDNVRTEIVYKDGVDPRYKIEAERLSARCKEMTALFCAAGRARYTKTEIPKEVLEWWDEHCELDRSHGEPW